MTRAGSAALAIVMTLTTMPAFAQSEDPAPRRNHLTLSGGIINAGGYVIGDESATLRRNTTGPAQPTPLFVTTSEIGGATGFEGRIGFALTRQISIEAGATYAKPSLDVTVLLDPEADRTEISEQITRYGFDIGGLWYLPVRIGSRVRPFAMGGAGLVWEAQDDRLIVDRGNLFQAGGGVQYWIRGGDATSGSLGARADVRYVRRSGGLEFDTGARSSAAFSLLAFAGF